MKAITYIAGKETQGASKNKKEQHTSSRNVAEVVGNSGVIYEDFGRHCALLAGVSDG